VAGVVYERTGICDIEVIDDLLISGYEPLHKIEGI
jgi:hypothetical protein